MAARVEHRAASERGYRPIRDYAVIGDMRTAALVASDGAIDWWCCPRFDSAAIFCRLLDARRGGWCRVAPAGHSVSVRAYQPGTNVLTTTFTTDAGQVRLTDFMPVDAPPDDSQPRPVGREPVILRLVEGVGGRVPVEVEFAPTFGYGGEATRVEPVSGGAVARAGRESLVLACALPLRRDASAGVVGRHTVAAGDRIWLALRYGDGDVAPVTLDEAEAERALTSTRVYWERWAGGVRYTGPYEDGVLRSALALKLLTFAPTGAIVAAPTTSLPETIGGVRNWDYRYTWLRDSALVLYALQTIGLHEAAHRFFDWLEAMCIGCCTRLQAIYTVDGGEELAERTLDHLEGYRGSRPVRVGNAAAAQRQLDIYGEVLDAAHLCSERMRPIEPRLWDALTYFADQAAEHWREPDHGLWEIRAEPRHFLYSKLFCWVALDRAVRLAESAGLERPARWRRTRDEIRQAIFDEGYDQSVGAFTQAFGATALDASALAIPLVGFLPPTDPRVRSTVARIQERLTSHGLVYRYLADDGLPGGEATFALCSLWLVDNLALCGRIDEARALFERVAGYANDVGLLAEQIDPVSGELRGNFPQGFTHLGLIRSALNITKAEKLGADERAERPAARARGGRRAGDVRRTRRRATGSRP